MRNFADWAGQRGLTKIRHWASQATPQHHGSLSQIAVAPSSGPQPVEKRLARTAVRTRRRRRTPPSFPFRNLPAQTPAPPVARVFLLARSTHPVKRRSHKALTPVDSSLSYAKGAFRIRLGGERQKQKLVNQPVGGDRSLGHGPVYEPQSERRLRAAPDRFVPAARSDGVQALPELGGRAGPGAERDGEGAAEPGFVRDGRLARPVDVHDIAKDVPGRVPRAAAPGPHRAARADTTPPRRRMPTVRPPGRPSPSRTSSGRCCSATARAARSTTFSSSTACPRKRSPGGCPSHGKPWRRACFAPAPSCGRCSSPAITAVSWCWCRRLRNPRRPRHR